MNSGSLLLVDDDKFILDAMAEFLRSLGHRTETAMTAQDAVARASAFPFDVVLCDVNLGDGDGFQVLEEIKRAMPKTEVILLTGYGSIEGAVDAIRVGAFDYLTKPLIEDELSLTIQRALGQRELLEENRVLKRSSTSVSDWGTLSAATTKWPRCSICSKAWPTRGRRCWFSAKAARGKRSPRGPFISCRTAARNPLSKSPVLRLPDSLLESELFGHVAGSFTGANHDKIGKFLQADGGTLFLDEIATASQSLQVKLLRVLQDREFEPVGGNKTHKVDVRLILATNQDLEEMVAEGQFRQDLYYRINVITLTQPALRERMGDIPLLLDHYLLDFNKQTGKKIEGFSEQAVHMLQRYAWPGNVRELVNVVERAVVLCKKSYIGLEDLPEAVRRGNPTGDVISSRGPGGNLKAALANPERQIILEALECSGWNRQGTAAKLGINRTTLYKKMKKYGITFENQLQQN